MIRQAFLRHLPHDEYSDDLFIPWGNTTKVHVTYRLCKAWEQTVRVFVPRRGGYREVAPHDMALDAIMSAIREHADEVQRAVASSNRHAFWLGEH
jgi:hypothetical protein